MYHDPSSPLLTSQTHSTIYWLLIHKGFQKFLNLSHNRQTYAYPYPNLAIFFVIKLISLIFPKFLSEVLKMLAASVYTDNWLLWNTSPLTLDTNTDTATNLLLQLGFSINWEVSLSAPSPQNHLPRCNL